MNKRLKQLAEQAGLMCTQDVNADGTAGLLLWFKKFDLERFAELVRQDERDKCAQDYLQDCCDAVDAARLEEREACAALVEGGNHVHPKAPDAVWAKTVAKLIRARGNHETT
jgi:hypothetical protein